MSGQVANVAATSAAFAPGWSVTMTALTWGGARAGMPPAGPTARSSSSGCIWPMSCASARARRAWRSKRTASPGTSNWMAAESLTVKKHKPSPLVPTMPFVKPTTS